MRNAAVAGVLVAMFAAGCQRVVIAGGDVGPIADGGVGVTPEPTVEGTRPESPANENLPLVLVRAEPAATVTIHRAPDCSDDPVGTGVSESGELEIPVGVPDDSTTTFWARATLPGEDASPCSTTSATYVEDSTAPDPPQLTGTDPVSPAEEPRPDVLGATEAGARITIFLGEDCEEPLAEGVAEADGTFRIEVELPPDVTSTVSARATDLAGNVSECSEGLSYRNPGEVNLASVFPPPSSQTNEPTLTVRGTTESPDDVVAVRVAGVEATSDDGFATWSALVPLGPDGETTRLEAVAETIDGALTTGPSVEVRRTTIPSLTASDIVVDPVDDVAFVADSTSGIVQVVDLATGRTRALPSGPGPRVFEPFALAWEADEDALLIGSLRGGQLIRVDPTTGVREEISGPTRGSGPPISGIRRIALDGERTAFIGTFNGFSQRMLAVDLITGDRTVVEGLVNIGLFTWDPTQALLVFYDFTTRSLRTLDPATGVFDTLSGESRGTGPALGFPLALSVDVSANELVVAEGGGSTGVVVDLVTGDRTRLEVGLEFGFIRAFDIDEAAGELVFIGTTVTETIWRQPRTGGEAIPVFLASFGDGPAFEAPTALALGGDRLFVADDALDAVFEVDLANGDRREISRSEELGEPVGLAYDPVGGELYVRDLGGQVAVLDPDTPGGDIGRIDIPPPVVTVFAHVGIDVDTVGRRLFIANRPSFVQVWDLEAGRLDDVSTASRGEGPLPFGFLPGGLAWSGTEVVLGDAQSALTVAPDDGDREDVSDGGGTRLGSFQGLDADANELWLAARQGVVAVDRETRVRRVVAGDTIGRGPIVTTPFDVAMLPGGDVALVVNRNPTGIQAIDRVTLERVMISR